MNTHTPGPWRWEVALNSKRVQLCGGPPKGGFGKYDLTVLSFARYGMSGAAPVFWNWRGMIGDPKRADALAAPVEGREHHANWFCDIDHPDARLIAAAPDLLEALQAMISANDRIVADMNAYKTQREKNEIAVARVDEFTSTLEPCRAAIAKATGQ